MVVTEELKACYAGEKCASMLVEGRVDTCLSAPRSADAAPAPAAPPLQLMLQLLDSDKVEAEQPNPRFLQPSASSGSSHSSSVITGQPSASSGSSEKQHSFNVSSPEQRNCLLRYRLARTFRPMPVCVAARTCAKPGGEVLVQVGVTANPRIGVSLQSLVVRVQVPFGTFSPLPGSAAGGGGGGGRGGAEWNEGARQLVFRTPSLAPGARQLFTGRFSGVADTASIPPSCSAQIGFNAAAILFSGLDLAVSVPDAVKSTRVQGIVTYM